MSLVDRVELWLQSKLSPESERDKVGRDFVEQKLVVHSQKEMKNSPPPEESK